jgi:Domain of unknown function (DUF4872)/Butirosin biosynthesis protein H, N-terminal
MAIIEDFKHHQHAHCESGVTTNLLQYAGVNMSEPMTFGIGAGIFFGHLPFLKVSGTPGTTFRTMPGAIFKKVTQSLRININAQRFASPHEAMAALDKALLKGIPVGVLSSVFYLPYLPEAFRFHFNTHNLVVYGKEGNDYIVSDPIMETPTRIAGEDLAKARFAKGFPEPKGYMYYMTAPPTNIDFTAAIKNGIKHTVFMMQSPPVPWFGNKAIFLLAGLIKKYPIKLSPRQATLYLGNIIRMQEEIGTGGAGFRYLYAAFLQEAGQRLANEHLLRYSTQHTAIGDQWRNFAYSAARVMKDRKTDAVSYDELGEMLRNIGQKEKEFFRDLGALRWS